VTLAPDAVARLIRWRRHQVLVHSILYYRFDSPLISDHTYDSLAQELIQLQREHPGISEGVDYKLGAFRDFTSSTGYDLPLFSPGEVAVAETLLKLRNERQES
jgi:NAD-dependent DNA ligase adenylation domain